MEQPNALENNLFLECSNNLIFGDGLRITVYQLNFWKTMSEALCLQWNDFKENVVTAFGSLRGDNDFTDVTLACEDGQQMEVHKIVLATSSPFFRNLFKRNNHVHPLVYMRGLKSDDLAAMLDFVYFCLLWLDLRLEPCT